MARKKYPKRKESKISDSNYKLFKKNATTGSLGSGALDRSFLQDPSYYSQEQSLEYMHQIPRIARPQPHLVLHLALGTSHELSFLLIFRQIFERNLPTNQTKPTVAFLRKPLHLGLETPTSYSGRNGIPDQVDRGELG
ncbi:hypothetical protein PMIN03_001993 [Paraphaeosphaeria minitans]